MSINYREIRTAAYRPAHPDAVHPAAYRALPFPEQWREAILDLCRYGRGGKGTGTDADASTWRTVPTHRFEQVLQAFAPDIRVMPRPLPTATPTDHPAHWLYVPADAPDPLPPAIFGTLVSQWLGDLRPELDRPDLGKPDPEYRALLKDVRAQLAATPPSWEPVTAELLACPTTVGGTAAPLNHQYVLSPDWLADRLLAHGPYRHGAGHLTFRAVPRGPRDKGAELVSQPLPYDTGKAVWWYSIVLNITLHTVPFDPKPRFHLHSGIRRWATRTAPKTGQVHIPYGRKATVLLRPQVPYLLGTPHSERYAVARLHRYRDPVTKKFSTDWVNGGPARLLATLATAGPFPTAEEILSTPEKLLTGPEQAGIVYSTAMGSHSVLPGLMPNQRSQLADWAAEALPEVLRPEPALRRTELAGHKPVNAPPASVRTAVKESEHTRRATERRAGAAHALAFLHGTPAPDPAPATPPQPVLDVRLIWQTRELREAAVAALVQHLELKGGGELTEQQHTDSTPAQPAVLEWESPELTVRMRCIRLGQGLGGALPIPSGTGRKRAAAVTEAADRRRADTAAWLAEEPDTVRAPSLALIEIDRPEDFPGSDHDPKFALRLGCARSGLVTQFVAVPKQDGRYNSLRNIDHRTLMAWDDGLRQLGIRVHPEHGLGERLPAGMRYLALWLVRKNRTSRTRRAAHMPVAVLITPNGTGSGLARVEGWDAAADDGAGAWVPYPSMLLKLAEYAELPDSAELLESAQPESAQPESAQPADTDPDHPQVRPRRSWSSDRAEQRRDTEEWIQRILGSLRRPGLPTMLLADAQNLRSHWTWLQDGRIERDRIRDGQAQARRLDPDLRLLRVRTGRGSKETAQWWGVHPKGEANGIAAHLWRPAPGPEDAHRPRVFYSTTPKPTQFKASSVEADKLAPRPLRQGVRKGELTIDTGTQGWTPNLVELAVLGCQFDDGDDPEALALAAHLLRHPPDYPGALTLPLPLHLAGRAQEYVFPPAAETPSEAPAEADPSPADPEATDPATDGDPVDAPTPEDEALAEPDGPEALFAVSDIPGHGG